MKGRRKQRQRRGQSILTMAFCGNFPLNFPQVCVCVFPVMDFWDTSGYNIVGKWIKWWVDGCFSQYRQTYCIKLLLQVNQVILCVPGARRGGEKSVSKLCSWGVNDAVYSEGIFVLFHNCLLSKTNLCGITPLFAIPLNCSRFEGGNDTITFLKYYRDSFKDLDV